jgi:NAD-dependent SIR2 family protein deacetylase
LGRSCFGFEVTSLDTLAELLHGRRIALLTGAGVSTESGIPDYRGPGTARRARNPVQYRAFLSDAAARRRYWARSVVGWPWFSSARPNAAHRALSELVSGGVATGLITQNVDRLHQAAGCSDVIELHGALAEVRCLDCGAIEERGHLQTRLVTLNPGWLESAVDLAPDGDAELDDAAVAGFTVAPCEQCGGVLKPNVVFFGESVPKPTVERAYELVDRSDALLVVGSSLAVFSGFRFVRRAEERGMPIGVVNLGETRADPFARVTLRESAGLVLPELVRRIGLRSSG